MNEQPWFPLHCAYQSHGSTAPHCGECAYCLANAEIVRLRRIITDVHISVETATGECSVIEDEEGHTAPVFTTSLWDRIAAIGAQERIAGEVS